MAGLPYRPSCGPALGLSSRVGPRSFCDLDHQDVGTNFGLTEVHAGVAPARLQGMLSRLHSWNQTVPGAIPTTDPYDRSFDPIRYWRGPVWVLVNWLVADGLIRSGEPRSSAPKRDSWWSEVLRGTTTPRNSDGIGGHGFSGSAALRLGLAPELSTHSLHSDPGGKSVSVQFRFRTDCGIRVVRPRTDHALA